MTGPCRHSFSFTRDEELISFSDDTISQSPKVWWHFICPDSARYAEALNSCDTVLFITVGIALACLALEVWRPLGCINASLVYTFVKK